MIHQSSYVATDKPRLTRPLEDFFEVDERIREESARVARGEVTEYSRDGSWAMGWMRFATDALAITSGAYAAWWLQHAAWGASTSPWTLVLAVVWAGTLVMGRCYPGWGIGPVDRLRVNVKAAAFAAQLTVLVRLLDGSAPWEAVLATALAVGVAGMTLAGTRVLVRSLAIKTGAWGVRTVLYGTTVSARRILQVLQSQPAVGFKPIGVFEDDPRMWGRELAGVPVLGDTGLVHPDAPLALVAGLSGQDASARVDDLLRYYRQVVIVPDLVDQSTTVMQPLDFGGLLGLQLRVNLASGWFRFLKRLVEVACVVITLPLWAPVVAVSSLLVWLEDGANPFYAQRRVGKGGKEIKVLKLRTMVPNAEEVLEQALQEDPTLRVEWEATSKLQRDPRITRVGAWLRRLSVDELPQLINVLRGQMALVGPRPLPAYHESRLEPEARELRRRVHPGVTGLWQISGRSDTGDEGIAWLDSYYVRNWSFWLDLAVLLRTAGAALKGQGAY